VFLQSVTLRDLRLEESSVDLTVRGRGAAVSIQVLRSEGRIRVSTIFS
jgi:hypothetical protein